MNSFLLLCDVFLFVFWNKLKPPKRHFKITWPLVKQNKMKSILNTVTYYFLPRWGVACALEVNLQQSIIVGMKFFSRSYLLKIPRKYLTLHRRSKRILSVQKYFLFISINILIEFSKVNIWNLKKHLLMLKYRFLPLPNR